MSNKVGESNESKHQWLDENGWEFRNVLLQNKNGDVYTATINIAIGKDDKKILYDINKIKRVIDGDGPLFGKNQMGGQNLQLLIRTVCHNLQLLSIAKM